LKKRKKSADRPTKLEKKKFSRTKKNRTPDVTGALPGEEKSNLLMGAKNAGKLRKENSKTPISANYMERAFLWASREKLCHSEKQRWGGELSLEKGSTVEICEVRGLKENESRRWTGRKRVFCFGGDYVTNIGTDTRGRGGEKKKRKVKEIKGGGGEVMRVRSRRDQKDM